ncbi:MAG: hypothetical protein N3A58_01605 [Spirochaetes bacterium]|nr:hypothetical protein [Spirochaetota bacterium]
MKYLIFNNRALISSNYKDSIVKYFLKRDIKNLYFTNYYNYKIAINFLNIKDKLSPYEKIYYLFENLKTKDYLDYPVYLFFYGDALYNKDYLAKLILKNEDQYCINFIKNKILHFLNLTKFSKIKKPILITFDNYHVIPINSPRIELIYKNQVENIYGLKGKIIWLNLSKNDEFKFIDFSRLKIYGKIWDPFMNWKPNFLINHDFEII